MIFMLVLLALSKLWPLRQHKMYKKFFIFYNIGVILTAVMLIIRGCVQVLRITLSAGADAALSGVAGIGHIITAIGIIFFFILLKRQLSEGE